MAFQRSLFSPVHYSWLLYWWHHGLRTWHPDGNAWCGRHLLQCCYSYPLDRLLLAFGDEMVGQVLRGHGASIWSSVGLKHFYCYCRHGPVDADLSPWCWLPLSLFRWFSHPGSPGLFGVSQQFVGVYSAVFQTRPHSSPGQAGGPVYWAGLSHATGPASYWQERVNYYSAGNMVWQAILQTAGVRVPYWPPPPWVQDCP